MNKFFSILLLTVVISAASCKKEDDPIVDQPKESPKVTILTPFPHTMIDLGDTLHINAEIEHWQNLHEYSVTITKASDGSEVWKTGGHDHDNMKMHVHEHWVNNVTMMSDLILTVNANDHDGRTGEAKMPFHAHNR